MIVVMGWELYFNSGLMKPMDTVTVMILLTDQSFHFHLRNILLIIHKPIVICFHYISQIYPAIPELSDDLESCFSLLNIFRTYTGF